ncbi:MAG: putative RNA methyltransferase, partial [Spongiibacteraceae bacterium]
VQACSKRNPGINGIVASNKKVPLPPDSQDLIICAFGFPVFEEFQRLLKASGQLVMLDVGPRHLLEMREILYPQVRQSDSQTQTPCSDTTGKWQLSQQATLEVTSPALNQQQLAWLLCMTPHGYRSSEIKQQQLLASAPLAVNIDVVLRTYHYVR